MKIKKIVDICRRSGRIVLMNDEAGRQWLGDGVGCYPLLDAPLFDEESLYATFDITEKQQENIIFQFEEQLPEKLCFADSCDGETFAERNDIAFYYKGEAYHVYHSAAGALYVKAKYLNPLPKDGLEIYQRQTESGTPYFVCKMGYMIQALMMPTYLDDNKEFAKHLDFLHEQSLKNRKVQGNE